MYLTIIFVATMSLFYKTFGIFTGEGVNLALEKLSEHSSSYNHVWGFIPADYAVDGISNTDFSARSCSHTETEYQPWWQVDLGNIYLIKKVEITNRWLPTPTHRLTDFRIETSVIRGDAHELAHPKLCYHQPNQHGNGATKNYTCTTSEMARFVRIQLQRTNALVLCEVRVFGSAVERKLSSVRRKHAKSKSDVIRFGQVRSPLECVVGCMQSDACTSINVGKVSESGQIQCEMLQDFSSEDINGEEEVVGWSHYVLV